MGLDGISLEFHYFLLFKGKVSIISSSKDLIKKNHRFSKFNGNRILVEGNF